MLDKAGGMFAFNNGLIHFASFTKQIQKITLVDNLGILMGLETIKPIGKVLEEGKTIKSRYANMWQWHNSWLILIARQVTNISVE